MCIYSSNIKDSIPDIKNNGVHLQKIYKALAYCMFPGLYSMHVYYEVLILSLRNDT